MKTNGNADGTGDPTLSASRILGYQDRIEINTKQLNARAPSSFYYDVNLQHNKITNLRNGTDDQDAVNVSQLRGVLTALGGGAAIDGDGVIQAPTYTIGGQSFNDVGSALANIDGILTEGGAALAGLGGRVTELTQRVDRLEQGGGNGGDGGDNSGVCVGNCNIGEGSGNVGPNSGNIGQGVHNGPNGSMSAGANASASGKNATAVGQKAIASGANSKADGQGAKATGDNSTAIGQGTIASGKNASAFGQGAQAIKDGSVALGQGSIADRPNTVSVGSKDHERIISNVAPGVQGTDAVNLDQLNALTKDTDNRLLDLDRNTRRGIAAAAALQNVAPYLPGRAVVSVNGATYRGQQAATIGLSYWSPKGNVNFNAAAAHARGPNTVARIGLAFTFGQ